MCNAVTRFFIGFLLLGMIGCGSDRPATHPVDGRVVFQDGGSLTFGTIEFYNEEHKVNARGTVKGDGSFTMTTFEDGDGAVAGKHKVVIMQIVAAPTGPHAEAKSKIVHNHGALVARKYLDYRTSGLTCDIKEGINEVKLVVEKGDQE